MKKPHKKTDARNRNISIHNCLPLNYLYPLYVVNQVTIGEGSHPENVKVYGPGVEKTGLKANEPTYFTVDCSEAGQGGTCLLFCYC